jgi:hypothetical protein
VPRGRSAFPALMHSPISQWLTRAASGRPSMRSMSMRGGCWPQACRSFASRCTAELCTSNSSARPMYGGDPIGSIVNSVKPRGMSGGALIDLGRISASRSNPTPDTLMQDLHRSTKHSCNTRLDHTCCQAGPGWGFFRRSFFGPYYNGPQDYYGPPPAYCPPLGY